MKELVVKNCLAIYRKEYGFTQEELAKASGTTRETISAIENNTHNPSLKLCLIISRVLNVELENIFYLGVVEVPDHKEIKYKYLKLRYFENKLKELERKLNEKS